MINMGYEKGKMGKVKGRKSSLRKAGLTVTKPVKDSQLGLRVNVDYNGVEMARYAGVNNVVYIRQSIIEGRHPFVKKQDILNKIRPYSKNPRIESLDG